MNIFFIIIGALIVLVLLWRLGSKRYVIPCPSYMSALVEKENPFAKENRSERIIHHLKLTEGMMVADIGCGPGRVTIPLSNSVGVDGKVLAMDIQQKMLDKIRMREGQNENIEYLQGSIGEGKLEKRKFDRILLVNVLGEIPNQKRALEEIFNALKPSGILSITETVFDPHYQRLSVLKKLLKSMGFSFDGVFGKWVSYTAHFKIKSVGHYDITH